MFSLRSQIDGSVEICAMNHAYVSSLAEKGSYSAHSALFALDNPAVVRDIFKVDQELVMLSYTESQIEKGYIERLIIGPLKYSVEVSESDLSDSRDGLEIVEDKFRTGVDDGSSVAEARLDVTDRILSLEKAKLELAKRLGEFKRVSERCASIREALMRKNHFNREILDAYKFSAPFTLEFIPQTFEGAFLERGDVICTIKRVAAGR